MLPTKPLLVAPPSTRVFKLTRCHVETVAEASRRAWLSFLEGSNGAWGKRHLAEWLAGPYRAAIHTTPRGIVRRPTRGGSNSVDAQSVESLLVRARGRLVDMLDERATWQASGFARAAVDASLVVGIHDERGALGYAPAAFEGMGLVDRVRSLILADYLTRPRDLDSLIICDDCGSVSFSWAETHLAKCQPAPPASGIVIRRATIAGVG